LPAAVAHLSACSAVSAVSAFDLSSRRRDPRQIRNGVFHSGAPVKSNLGWTN